MAAIITNKMRINTALGFRDSFNVPGTNVYLAIGKSSPWPDDNMPPLPVDNADINNSVYREMLALKKINASDVSLVIPSYRWVSGATFSQYSHLHDVFNPSLSTPPYYTTTDDMNVYKCMFNNGGAASTIKPTGTSVNVFQTSDGYKWKFMYTVPSADVIKFSTNTWIPIKTLTSNDGSSQWTVQQAAIPGAIDRIDLLTPGTNYTVVPTVTIVGDGTGATATATINSGGVSSIIVTSSGTGYTYATVTITGGGVGAAGASTQAVMSPILGHGADPVYELSGRYVMMNVQPTSDESGSFTVGNDYRQISVIKNPILLATSGFATGLVYNQTNTLTFGTVAGGDFVPDDLLTGSVSGATAKVVDYNSTTKVTHITNVVGDFVPGEAVQNSSATVAGTLEIYNGTLQSASVNTIQFPVGASTVNDFYKDMKVKITSGPGAGQIGTIASYIGVTRTATMVTPFGVSPNNTSLFSVAAIFSPSIKANSGDLLYIENRRPIARDIDQTEIIRIVMTY